MKELREQLLPKGRVEVFVTRGRPTLVLGTRRQGPAPIHSSCEIDFSKVEILDQLTLYNIIVNFGKDAVINSLMPPQPGAASPSYIVRMSVGDRGTIPSDSTVPKSPTAGMTELYNEVYRGDVDSIQVNTGTPSIHEVKLTKTFSAVDVPITAFSNQAKPVVNEVGLITADIVSHDPLPRPNVFSPDAPPADERLFSIRTFKTVPFDAANEIAVTIRYTIYIE